jgi:adenylosuccinate synthase
MDNLIKAANINGVTNMIVNKVDVLEKVGTFKLDYDGITFDFKEKGKFKEWFNKIIRQNCPLIEQILFSESMEII